jgi:hypothetical protein
MNPTLAWLDFNAAERERTQRILAMFDEKETRDELGLGAIRDSISDHLFPGTSTIQTRLRYLFFIPWIYLRLERQRVPSREIATKARKLETELTTPLLGQIDNAGVFGRLAKGGLKRLPSSVYWAGLRQYGICLYPGGREDYHRDLDAIYRRRDRTRHESDGGPEPFQFTWHPKLPEPQPNFPEHPRFRLTRAEGHFFRDCLMRPSCNDSLLAHLAWHCEPAEVDFPWQHPRLGSFSDKHQELLENARLFSITMHGAAILYNLLLAEAGSLGDLEITYRDAFQQWAREMAPDRHRVEKWILHRFWQVARHPAHTITTQAQSFVKSWVGLFLEHGSRVVSREDARKLVRNREVHLKGPRSRFQNPRALEKWGGEAGLRPVAYRWYNAKTFLRDLAEGLKNQ